MNEKEFVVLVPPRRLDAAGVRGFEEEWKNHIAAGHSNLLVDMEGTSYVSSSGLRSLLAAARSARKHNGDVKLCSLNQRIREIIEMAGFDRVFEVYADRAQAEASLRR